MAALGTDLGTAAAVVIATVGIVLALVVLVRIGGQRSLATMSAVDIACVGAVGAVVGRTTLLAVPTLATGVLALVVLFLLRHLLSGLEQRVAGRRFLARRPVFLVYEGRLQTGAMRRARISEDDLRQRLRLAGATGRHGVRMAVLERTGQISVLCADVDDEWLLGDLEMDRCPQSNGTSAAGAGGRSRR